MNDSIEIVVAIGCRDHTWQEHAVCINRDSITDYDREQLELIGDDERRIPETMAYEWLRANHPEYLRDICFFTLLYWNWQ